MFTPQASASTSRGWAYSRSIRSRTRCSRARSVRYCAAAGLLVTRDCVSVLVAMLIVSPSVGRGRLRGLRRRRLARSDYLAYLRHTRLLPRDYVRRHGYSSQCGCRLSTDAGAAAGTDCALADTWDSSKTGVCDCRPFASAIGPIAGVGRQAALSVERDDDLAVGAALLDVRQSLEGLVERERLVDERAEVAGVVEGGQLAQLGAVGLHEQKRVGHA
jgi:hypothetical protein